MVNKADYVELGLACADVCASLKRGLDGNSEDNLNDSVHEAIRQLRRRVTSVTYTLSISLTMLPT